jgi:hypothetical protein
VTDFENNTDTPLKGENGKEEVRNDKAFEYISTAII